MTRAQILVADSNPDFAAELAANLKSLGYAVAGVVSSLEEALKKAEEKQPDLVLLDLKLLADGHQGKTARQIRKRLKSLVYLVGEEDRKTLQRAKITHSFDYLRKACDTRELETIIDMALYRRKLEGEMTGGGKAPAKPDAGMKEDASGLESGIDRHQSLEETLQAERQKLYHLLDTLPAYVVLLAPDYSVPFANREFIERFGAPEGRKCYDFLFGRTSPCQDCETYKVLETNAPHDWEWTGPDGRNYQIHDFPFRDNDGSPLILEMGVDVTVLKEKEAQIRRANRALQTLSSVNQAVVRAHTEAELLEDVCRAVVAEGGYRLTWIGYAENDREKTVRPVAQAGYEEGYLETLNITWADKTRGRGPTGTAIRTGQPALARNIPTDPLFAPWRQEAVKRGYASSLVLPLLVDGQAFGALNIYAGEADAFDTGEVQLLADLAADVSFGIMALRGREERRRMAAALRHSYEELEARVQDRTRDLAQANAALQTEITERLWSEKKLRESEERYRRLVDLSPDAIAVQSQGEFLFVNPAGAQLFGADSPQAMVGKRVPEVIHPDFRQLVTARISRVNAPGAKTDLQEIKILRLDGRVVDVEASGVGIEYQGRPAVQVMLRDITVRKEMEKKLEHLASFPQLNPNPVLEVDTSGALTFYNAAAKEALKNVGMAIVGVWRFLPPDLHEILKTAQETGETLFQREVKINGAIFLETLSFIPEAKVLRIYATDITERQRAERERQELLEKLQASEEELQATVEELQAQTEELQAQTEELLSTNQQLHEALAALQDREAQLHAIFDSLTEGLVVADLEGRLLHWNPAAIAMHGVATLEECRRRLPEFANIFELSTLEDGILPLERWPLARILAGETLRDWEVRVRRHGTDWQRVFSYGGRLAYDQNGQPLLAVVTVNDITERKQAEEMLRKSNQHLDLMAETASQLLASASPPKVVDSLCQRAMAVLDCDAYFNFLHNEKEGRLRLNAFAGIPEEEARLIEWLDYGVAVCGCAFRDGCRIVTEDILNTTDPRTELIKSYGIQAYACHPLMIEDRVLGTLSFGTRTRSSFTPDELALMKAVADLVAIAMERRLAEEALRESREDLNRAQAVAHTGSWRLNLRKNELLWSDETYRIFGMQPGPPLSYESFLAAVYPEDREYVDQQWQAAIRGEPYDIEHRIVVGDAVKWVRERAELEFDHQGQLKGGFGTVQDITERKDAETTLQASSDFLEIANRHTEMAPLLQDFVAAVKEHTGCEAVAIRILDEQGRIPYEAHKGFPPEFIACESPLSIDADHCLCINVCRGTIAPDLPFYTPGSSCFINRFSQLLATDSRELLGYLRNACHRFGFESVALIPIGFGGNILGLIHLADHRENRVPLALVTRLERIALTLGTAINRVRAEEAWRQALAESRQRQAEIAALLQATRAVLEAGNFQEIGRSHHIGCKSRDRFTVAGPDQRLGCEVKDYFRPRVLNQALKLFPVII